MKKMIRFGPLLIALFFISLLPAAPPPSQMTVLDCYLLLPPDFLATTPAAWLRHCGLIDSKNGYMRCEGESAQVSFQILLLHYADGHPLLVVCQGQLNGGISRFLDFFEITGEHEIRQVARSIFPVPDSDYNEGKDWFFDLPHGGQTILVRHQENQRVLHKIAWTGEKFVEQK